MLRKSCLAPERLNAQEVIVLKDRVSTYLVNILVELVIQLKRAVARELARQSPYVIVTSKFKSVNK